MKLLLLLLFLLFIYNLFFSNLATAQIEEPLCAVRIYDTGLYLGWGSALLEYTQNREAPSPFDQVIYEQLQGAHNSVERAALAVNPQFLLGQVGEISKIIYLIK